MKAAHLVALIWIFSVGIKFQMVENEVIKELVYKTGTVLLWLSCFFFLFFCLFVVFLGFFFFFFVFLFLFFFVVVVVLF